MLALPLKLLLLCHSFAVLGVSVEPEILAEDQPTCLQDLRVLNASATTVSLAWDYRCQDEVEKFKVDYNHKRFHACQDKRKDRKKPHGFGTVEMEPGQHAVVIRDLHPYSDYKFQVRVILASREGRPETGTVVGSTLFSIPTVKARPSTVDYSFRNTATKLVFNWSPPLASTQCNLFNAELGQFVYRVKGTNPWSRNLFREDSVALTDTLAEVTGLQPFSDYMFLLYLTNTAGEYDEDYYLKLEGRTLPSVPDPPVGLATADKPDPGTIHMHWRPQYPHKGTFVHTCIHTNSQRSKSYSHALRKTFM